MRRAVLLSWSGGKDAAWTLHRLRQCADVEGDAVEVVGLLTTVTSGYERIAMHGIRRDILQAQAAAAGLPVIEAVIPPQCDNATYEASFAAALAQARARWPACASIAFGDLFLADVRAWREALCARLGWTPLFPLFGSDTALLAREMIDGGLRAALCCVDTQQLDARFSGRAFDHALLDGVAGGMRSLRRDAASSTPAFGMGRCSPGRWRSRPASRCCATTASPTPISRLL